MDTQVVELLGRGRLIEELLRAGLEVAIPQRDRGIDLIAYLDLDEKIGSFVARPRSPASTCTFALDHAEAVAIGDALGWTDTSSWRDKGHYTTQRPSRQLREQLEPHRMTPEAWRSRIAGSHRA